MTTIRLGRWPLRFDWQIVPWTLSALLGGLIAYRWTQGIVGFVLVAVGAVLYLLFHNIPDGRSLRWTLVLLPVLVTIIYLIVGDWSHALAKLPLHDSDFQWLATVRPSLGITVNSNVAGGVLAMLIPLQVLALHKAHWATQAVMLGVTSIGLVLSASRGAWLALLLTAAMWLAWQAAHRHIVTPRRARIAWLIAMVSGALGLFVILALTPLGDQLLGLGGDRPAIWHNSVDLLSDYPVTGLGFGSFEMAYSTYVLLAHVGHTLHAHNLWLNVWLVQGLWGALALVGLTLNAVWPRAHVSRWRNAGLSALSIVLIHGLFDDAFYGYGGAAMPLLLIPVALATRAPESEALPLAESARAGRFRPARVVWAGAVIGLAVLILTPSGRAVIEANLGALAQTQAELSVYRWPDVPIQDVLRQSEGVDLAAAMSYYDQAIALDSTNTTANRRLGQIELARGEYGSACSHLQKAYTAKPDQRATHQLLGECLALDGDTDRAGVLWRDIDLSQGQIMARLWWYDNYLALPDQARHLRQVADLLDIKP